MRKEPDESTKKVYNGLRVSGQYGLVSAAERCDELALSSQRQIEDLVVVALRHAPGRRGSYLDDACGGDDALRAEVERRIRREESATSEHASMSDTCAPTEPPSPDMPRESPPALRIEAYKILDVVGEGSMGVVYRAQQKRPHRLVALKVLKAGGVSAQSLHRMDHEAQMLGRLQHPAIAQIFEAGTAETEYGPQPFFAMELVDGVPITKFAREHDLSSRDRLELLAKVCEGVEHAHQKGVIHRDLKPGNILVDRSGQPKILDFGIAVASEGGDQAGVMSGDRRPTGTIPYMSIEQARGDLSEIDTRTDVYALGVIAYQLLSGELPYDLKNRTIADAIRIIARESPATLSNLDSTFRGDVDAIVAKALKRDKSERYQSASDLAADIRRYLRNDPVSAHPANAIYLFRKFAGRNKVLVGSALAVSLMLVIAVVGMGFSFGRASREAEKATEINRILIDMFASADPGKRGKDVTVRAVLDAASDKIEAGDLSKRPEVESEVRLTLGNTYRALGLTAEAEPHLTAALAIARKSLGDRHEQTLRAMNELAHLYKNMERFDEAEALYREALRGRRAVLGEGVYPTLETMHNLAALLKATGKLDDAESLYRRVLTVVTALPEPGEEFRTLETATKNSLAALLKAKGQRRKAEELYRQVLAARIESRGDDHLDTAKSMNNLAVLLKEMGKRDEAEQLFRRVLDIRRRLLPPDHPETLNSLNNLARLFQAQNNLDEAEPLFVEALEISRRVRGEYHSRTLGAMSNLGELYVAMGRLEAGEPLLAKAVQGAKEKLPPGHWFTGVFLTKYGECLTKMGRYEQGAAALRDAHSILVSALGADHERTRRASDALVALYDAWGKPGEADRFRTAIPNRPD